MGYSSISFSRGAKGKPLARVQVSTVFAAGILVQSAQFPPVVSFF